MKENLIQWILVINTRLTPGFYDVDERMLHGCMSLLADYIHRECGGIDKVINTLKENDPEDLSHHSDYLRETIAIYTWWTKDRPAHFQKLSDWGCQLFPNDVLDPLNENNPYGSFDDYHDYNDKLDEDDQNMLIRLISIRRHLWS